MYETVEAEVVAAVMEAAAAQASPWDAVRAGLSTFLDACLSRPSVGSWCLTACRSCRRRRWRWGSTRSSSPCSDVLSPLLGTATFDGMAIDALAHVALGGLYGASLYSPARDPPQTRAEVDRVLDTLIRGLLGNPSSADGRRSSAMSHAPPANRLDEPLRVAVWTTAM